MNTIVNGGANDARFGFRVGGDTPRDVESASLVDGQVVIGDTGTPAVVGDFYRGVTGDLEYIEIPITAVGANSFTIATTTLPQIADTFYVMRRATQRVDDTGGQIVIASSGPVQFVLDSVATEVEEDTAVPANSRPLPVKAFDPSGVEVDFATAPKQDQQTAILTTIDSDTSILAATVTANRIQVDVVSSALPTGAATEATLSSIDGKTPNLGQAANAASVPVTLSTEQDALLSAIDASTQALSNATAEPGVGTTDNRGLAVGGVDGTGDFYRFLVDTNGVQTVSIGTSALPTGAATLAEQQAQTAILTTIDADTSALAGAVVGTEVQVDIVASLPAGTNNIGDVDVLTLPVSFDTGASDATTQRVVLATGQTVQTASSGKTVSGTVRNDYTSTSVTTGAWVELISSTAAAVTEIEIFDSSGQTLELGTGAAASEARLILVFPGGNGRVPVSIASGTRLSIRAVSGTASVGELGLNLYN